MLLRIIDKPTANLENDLVEVQFTLDSTQKNYTAEYFPSPYSTGLKDSLSWYFNDYLLQAEGSSADKDVATKVLQLGQHMADNLLGEDHQLMSITEQITENGIGELHVALVSSRLAFFEELWECAILPESSFILSGAAASFTRCFDKHEVSDVLQLGHSAKYPLKYVTIIDEQSNTPSEFYQMHIESFGFKRVLCHEVMPLNAISPHDTEEAQGIVHLSADIHFLDDGSFTLGQAALEEASLIDTLRQQSTHLVIVSSCFYSADEQCVESAMGLAWLSQRLLHAGIKNVVGFGQYTDPWTIQQNISALLQALVQGVSVSRAVVEARKSLQRNTASQVFANQGVQFQSWSLLQHYQSQDVRFITQGVEIEAAEESSLYNELRRSMHGFVSEYIFPTAFPVTNGNATPAIVALESSEVIHLQGHSGSGKTHTSHQIATWYISHFLQQNPDKIPEQALDLTGAEQAPKALPETQAFYFDFNHHAYTEKDITDMIAPTVGIDPRSETMSVQAVWEKLAKSQSLVVLDNIEQAADTAKHIITKLIALHCKVIVSSTPTLTIEQASQITLRPLNHQELRAIVAHQLRLSGISQVIDLEVLKLIEVCQGNPFLAVNLAKQLRNKSDKGQTGKSAQALSKQVAEHIDMSNSDIPLVQQYMRWQWTKMPDIAKGWLGLLADIPDVLLEMFSIVAGRATPDYVELVKVLNNGVDPDDSQLDFGSYLQQFVVSGFATRYPHGRMLRKTTLSFVQQEAQSLTVLQDNKQTLTVMLAKVIAASLLKLLPQIQRKPDQQIVQTLLAHRDIWARQLEVLWAAEQYGYFLGLMQQLTAFLTAYQLGQEMMAWSAKLMLAKRVKQFEFDNVLRVNNAFDVVNSADEKASRQALERLVAAATLANQAAEQLGDNAVITASEVEQLTVVFKQMVSAWESALATFIDTTEQKWAVLAQHGLQMLVVWYRKNQAWEKLYAAAKTCQQIYQQYEAWPRVISATQQILEACVHLKDTSGIADAEKLILRDVPYDKFPPGTFLQNAMQIVIGRVSRREDTSAQALVDELRELPDAKPLASLLDAVQADIYLLQEEFPQALRILFMQWDELVKQAQIEAGGEVDVAPQGPNAEMLKEKLLEIKEKVGTDTYQSLADTLELTQVP